MEWTGEKQLALTEAAPQDQGGENHLAAGPASYCRLRPFKPSPITGPTRCSRILNPGLFLTAGPASPFPRFLCATPFTLPWAQPLISRHLLLSWEALPSLSHALHTALSLFLTRASLLPPFLAPTGVPIFLSQQSWGLQDLVNNFENLQLGPPLP